jgi:diguanylate cyclase (GGDEF)-like protein
MHGRRRSDSPEEELVAEANGKLSREAAGERVAEPDGELLDDARQGGAVERPLEDSWRARSRRADRREQLVVGASSLLFLAIAIPLAVSSLADHPFDPLLALALMLMYALCSGLVRFPIGAGYVVPSYMVLVPMLLLLPPGVVPLLVAAGLVLGTAAQAQTRRTAPQRTFFAVSDAWHTLGPAVVLLIAGAGHSGPELALIYAAAFAAGCLVDLVSATLREAAIIGPGSRVQLGVVAIVWMIDACIAPLGLLVALAVRQNHAAILLILPLNGVLVLLSRERTARIAQAQQRLDLLARERVRLQAAVRRLADALAAKLDLDALIEIVLSGSLDALDADAGRLILCGATDRTVETRDPVAAGGLLDDVAREALARDRPAQLQRAGLCALALPFSFSGDQGLTRGVLAVARQARSFRGDEEEVMRGLVERARQAAEKITTHEALRQQAHTDALTGLGNRRQLEADLSARLQDPATPVVLLLFDLNGFKSYNDTFGHVAGDAVLSRLGTKLARTVASHGGAYRLGGDEFCALLAVHPPELHTLVSAAAAALEERGERFAVGASYGAVALPYEANDLDYALQLADERMYARKRGRASRAGDQARDVLLRIMHAKQPSLEDHADDVAQLCLRVGRRMAMTAEELDELGRAAELHDVGKVGIPDAILEKPGALDAGEWDFMRQHTLLGERILSAAPALRPVALLVRASHERWDGGGYPDGLAAEQIPLGARIIAACDAYDAMTSDRVYRKRRDHASACDELRAQAGHHFDPRVVDVLLAELHAMSGAHGAIRRRREREPETRERHTAEVVAHLQEVIARGESSLSYA